MTSQYILLAIGVAIALIAGVSDARSPEKMVSQSFARLNESRHYVSLRLNNKHICGGSILGGRHVLTAANCVMKVTSFPFDNLVIATTTTVTNGPTYGVSRIFYYCGNELNKTMTHDIAVIVLKKEINLLNSNKEALSVRTSVIYRDSYGHIVGYEWPSTHNHSYNLKSIGTGIAFREQCVHFFPEIGTLETYQFCGVNSNEKDRTSSVDIGGALVAYGQYVGLLTSNFNTPRRLPDIYINLSVFREWIEYIVETT